MRRLISSLVSGVLMACGGAATEVVVRLDVTPDDAERNTVSAPGLSAVSETGPFVTTDFPVGSRIATLEIFGQNHLVRYAEIRDAKVVFVVETTEGLVNLVAIGDPAVLIGTFDVEVRASTGESRRIAGEVALPTDPSRRTPTYDPVIPQDSGVSQPTCSGCEIPAEIVISDPGCGAESSEPSEDPGCEGDSASDSGCEDDSSSQGCESSDESSGCASSSESSGCESDGDESCSTTRGRPIQGTARLVWPIAVVMIFNRRLARKVSSRRR